MAAKKRLSRRSFLANSTKAVAAWGAGSVLVGRQAAAAPARLGANDQIRFALIGSGKQGTHDAHEACGAPNVICVALCDVAEFRLARSTKLIAEIMDKKGNPNVKIDTYDDYRKLLERKDLHAVLIATPDHWHCRPFLAALEAGKHIYQEKPMSYTIEQGLEMVAAAQKHPELTVQIGTQRRSGAQYLQAKALIDEGKLGKIVFARAYDSRNCAAGKDPFAPTEVSGKIDWDQFQEPCPHKVPYDPRRYFAWRWYWDYAGGLVTDVGVHVIDVVHWLTGKDTPKSAVCNGGTYALKYWETPDVVDAVWDYGSHAVAFTSDFGNGWEGVGLTLFGTQATLELRGHDIYVWAEDGRSQRGLSGKPLYSFPARNLPHTHNWLACIRSGARPNAPVELGFSSLLPSHLANLAYRRGTKVAWDPVAKKVT